MCLDSLNWGRWVRFHGQYWYQSYIDGSYIWGMDRTDPWGPEMDHPPLGRSYLVVVPSYDMSCALILLSGLYGWDSMVDIDINSTSMGSIFGAWIGPTLGVPKWTIRQWAAAIWQLGRRMICHVPWFSKLGSMGEIPWSILISILHRWVPYFGCWYDRPLGSRNGPSAIGPQLFGSSAVVYIMGTDSLNRALWVRFHRRYWYQSFINGYNSWSVDRVDSWDPEMDHPPLGCSYLVVVPSYDMSCALILLTGLYGWDSMVDIDINPTSMSPIFGVWIGPTLGVPKWTIRHWAAAIW